MKKQTGLTKRFLAGLVTVAMCFSMLPTGAWAEGAEEADPAAGGTTSAADDAVTEATPQTSPGGEAKTGDEDKEPADGEAVPADEDKEPAAGEEGEPIPMSEEEPGISLLSFGAVEIAEMQIKIGSSVYTSGQTAMANIDGNFELSFKLGGDPSWVNRTVDIDVPVGWKIVAAPGVSGIKDDGTIQAKSYTPEEQITFASAPTFVWDGVKTVAGVTTVKTKSGTLSYEIKDNTVGYVITVTMAADSTLYDFSGAQNLKDLTISFTGVDSTDPDTTSNDKKSIGAQLGTGSMANTARVAVNTNQYANTTAQDAAEAYLGQEQFVWIAPLEDLMVPKDNVSKQVYGLSFEYTYPKGAEVELSVTTQTGGWSKSGEPVDNSDGTMTQKFTCSAAKAVFGNDARMDGRYRCRLKLTYPEGMTEFVEGGTYTTTVSNLSWKTLTIDADEEAVECVHTAKNKATTVTKIIETPEFRPPYAQQVQNAEAKNGYDGVQVQLARVRMYLKTGTGVANDPVTGKPIVSGSSATAVRFSYQGDTRDNVSYVSIPVSSADVKTNLNAIHIEYKDGTSQDWSKGTSGMPGAIAYYSGGDEPGTAWRFTAPAGKYIKSAYVEYTKVTPTEAMASPSGYGIAKGRPVNDEYTGIFSHHEFFTQQWDAANNQWVTVSTSNLDGEADGNYQKETDHGGFRWIKPDPFELNATGTNKTTSNSFAALGNTKEEETLDPVMPGAVKLASYEFSNQTGNKCTDQVKVDIALNQNGNQDLVSLVQFPYSYVADADEAAKQVESITYTYTDGTTETWTKASGKPYPFTPGSTSGTMTAPDGKYFASVSVTLTGWNASLQTSSVYLAGKPATDRYEGETSSHKITVTPVSGTDPFCSTSAGFNFRKATAQYVAPAGTAIEVDAGTDGVLKVNLKAGYRSSNGIGGLQEECSQHYGHSTFAFILPNDLTPTGTALTVTWPENTLGYPTTTATLQSKHSATAAELAAANMEGLSATVYTYAFADQDMTWISRYGGANTTPQVSLPFEVDPLADNYLFTYAQLFYAGSNLTADMNGGTQPALNCPTEDVVTYTNGDKDVVVSTTRYTDNGFDTKVGVTDNIIRGDSATVKINRNPSLIVREHIAASDGVDKVYDGTDDSIAKFKEGETGTIKLNVFNAVSEAAGVKVKYGFVFVPIPKASANSDQVTDHQFDFVLGGVPTYDYVTSDISSIEAHYVMGTTSVNAGNAETIYNAASTTYNANATMVAFRLEDLIAGKGMGITIPIKAPDFVTDTALYDQLQARSVYVYNDEGAWTTYNAGEKYGYLRASYVNPRWTLTCNTQGGSTVASQTVKDGEQWVTPATPTRGGYTFGGWYTDAACTDGKEYKTFPVTPSEDKTIYAKWVETTYTVQYDTTGGTPTTIDDKTGVKWDDAGLLPATDPTRPGYTFGGWNTKADGTGTTATTTQQYGDLADLAAVATTTLYAQWHENANITITYVSEDTQKGTVNPANESLAPASDSAQGSTAAAKTGYHLDGWYNAEGTKVGAVPNFVPAKVDGLNVAATYTAKFVANTDTKYVVRYYQQDTTGTGYTEVTADKADKTGTTDAAIDATLLNKTYTGFAKDKVTYENTTTAASTTVLKIAPDGKLLVKVYYTRNAHDVTYNANGHSTAPSGQTDVRFGALVTDPGNLTADGYTFGGWYTDAACTDANKWNFSTSTMPDNDVTLYAKWTLKQYTVAFESGAGGSIGGVTTDQTVDYLGHATGGCTATPADSDHEFLGWRYHYTAVDGTTESGTVADYTTVPVKGPSDGKLTFTAIFAKKPFTAIRGTNGLVSIAKDTVPVTPTEADAVIELSALNLPAALNMKFQPISENYTLAATDAIVVVDIAGHKQTLTNGTNTFTPQGQTDPITIVVDTTAGTIAATKVNDSIEFDVVYEPIQTTYKVEHYVMKADGSYPTAATDSDTMPSAATTIAAGSAITFTPKTSYTGATYNATKTTYEDSAVTTPQATATTVKFDGSTVVKLYYDRSGHTVSYNVQGHGTAPAAQTPVLFGAKVTEPTAPTAPGYTFGGWYTDAACADANKWNFATGTMPNNDMTLYAKWTEQADITLSYASESATKGSVSPASESVAPATGYAAGSAATAQPGYHFVKWTNSLDATETTDATLSAAQVDAVAKTSGIYQAVTFTAHFAEDADVTLTYASEDTNKGTVSPASATVHPATGTPADLGAATPATGYHFVNWTNNQNSTVTTDATLTTAQVNAAAKDGDGIYRSTTFTAHFAANPYTVEFKPGTGGTGTAMPDQSFVYDEEKPLSSNTYTKPGHHFIGWNTVETATTAMYTDAQSVSNLTGTKDGKVTLYAIWAEDGQITLTYNATTGGATNPASEAVSPATGEAKGSTATADAGYHFVNWTVGSTATEAGTDATLTTAQVDAVAKTTGAYVATTFTANFAPNAYEVVFDGNNSLDTPMPNQSFTYDAAQNLTGNTYTRAGFTFAGWATTADATTAEYTDGQSVKNLTTTENGQVTLYAVWTETAPVTLTYMVATTDNAKGSVAPLTESVKPVSGTPDGSTATANAGYHFEKWTNSQTGGSTTDAVLTPAQVQAAAKSTGVYLATTFTAHFAPNTDTAYTVEYWQQNVDDNNYTKVDADTVGATGTTDAAIDATLLNKTYTGFTKDKVTYENTTTAASTTVLKIAPDGKLLVKVYYTRHAHDVTYNANGHSTAPSGQTDVRFGALVTDPGNLTATGYEFGGWYTDAACTDANKWDFGADTMPDNDITLYAKWTPKTYTVSFTNDGTNHEQGSLSGADPQTVAYGNKPNPDCTCTITDTDNYQIVGWKYNYTAADGTTKHGIAIGATGYQDVEIFGDVTFDAVIYKVPFVTATGVNGFVSIAKTAGELTDPTVKEVSLPDITYSTLPTSAAVQFKPESENYKLVSITVSDYQTAPQKVVFSETDLADGKTLTLATVDKAGDPVNVNLTLKLDAGGNTGHVSSGAANIGTSTIFTVVYEAIQTHYKVEHYLMGTDGNYPSTPTADETLPASGTIAAGSTITFTPNTYPGAGYDATLTTYQDSETPASATVTTVKHDGSTVVKLYYKRSTHTVTYNAQGYGTAPAPKTGVVNGATFAAPTDTDGMTQPGYTWDTKWYTDAACTTEWNFATDAMPNSDLTLYAKWTENAAVTIRYSSENTDMGTVNNAQDVVKPATGTAAGSTAAVKPGYKFVNWTKKSDGSVVSTSLTLLASELKVGGIYVAETYIANFVPDTDTEYKVEYYRQDATGTGYTQVTGDALTKYGTTGMAIDPSVLNKTYPPYFTKSKVTYTDNVHGERSYLTIAPDGSLVVRVYYNRILHNVTFDPNGHGMAPDDESVRHEGLATKPTDPTADGYTFTGWFLEDGTPYNFATPVTEDLKLVAGWKLTPKHEPGDNDDNNDNGNNNDVAPDETEPAAGVQPTSAPVVLTVPKTSDDTPLTLLLVLMALSAVGLVVAMLLKKRKNKHK